jgi:hypothetical protein
MPQVRHEPMAVVGELSASRPGRFTAKERVPGTRLVGPSSGLNTEEKWKTCTLLGIELHSLSFPDRSFVTILTELPLLPSRKVLCQGVG